MATGGWTDVLSYLVYEVTHIAMQVLPTVITPLAIDVVMSHRRINDVLGKWVKRRGVARHSHTPTQNYSSRSEQHRYDIIDVTTKNVTITDDVYRTCG